jgi:type II secretory pathway component PulC
VNGKPLTSMKEAMDAWQSLQNEGGFNFEITRRGQRQTMEYTVR